jgi:hypothetical protein
VFRHYSIDAPLAKRWRYMDALHRFAVLPVREAATPHYKPLAKQIGDFIDSPPSIRRL